jgi:regulator of protease activity HflC (stomatin/prohibitin superfamily)
MTLNEAMRKSGGLLRTARGGSNPMGRTIGVIVLLLFVVYLAADSYFIVQPTEMAGVRQLGIVRTKTPLGPGFHLKLPLLETADRLQVSLDSFRIDHLTIYTHDNQAVTIGVGITYRIPPEAVLKLLYAVGGAGNVDIERNLHQIIADRALRVFARRTTVKISDERDQVTSELRAEAENAVRDLFGVKIEDLQIPSIQYSQTFISSVEAAVKAKNDAIAAENTVNRIRFEGEQRVVTAKADAEAQVARATAEKQAQILKAEGEARTIELRGQADAASIRVRGEALAGHKDVVGLILAQRWTGQPPQTILGSQAVPFFNLPGAPGQPVKDAGEGADKR